MPAPLTVERKSARCWAMLLLVSGLCVAAAEAQPATSLEQLRWEVKLGDSVIVIDAQGRETTGSVAEMSPSMLGLLVDGRRIDFVEADLETVARRDSRWNGTLWGLAVGAALGIPFEKSLADTYGRDDVGYGSVAVPMAALGAGLGFAVDAMIKGRRIIYTRAGRTTTHAMLVPAWSAQRKGVLVSLWFR